MNLVFKMPSLQKKKKEEERILFIFFLVNFLEILIFKIDVSVFELHYCN